MNRDSRITLSRPVLIAGIVILMVVSAGGTYFWMRQSARGVTNPTGTPSVPITQPQRVAAGDLPDVIVPLSEVAVKRAGIELALVTVGAGTSQLRIPGTVEPNTYKQVVVTSLVAGRVTRVLAQLGDAVRRGQTLAQIFSPELADAQTKYLSAKAELEAHERELGRTTKLVEIGAASQQELERLHAEHAAKIASVQSLRSRLVLLGMPAPAIDALSPGKEVDASANIPAPIAGVVTVRDANAGLNVDTSSKLFTIVDLSSVWVVGALYERDFSRVHVGSDAIVTTTAYPGLAMGGRVSYIDPQIGSDTRTARVRVEVPNPRQELRLGMYADIEITTNATGQTVTIPRSAVQNVADRQVVYVANANEPWTYREREVRLGDASGERVEVLSGVKPGDHVVSTGSFYVRAERERLSLGSEAARSTVPPAGRSERTETPRTTPAQTAKIAIGEQGFQPARVALRSGVPADLTFTRTTDKTCATAVVFPSLNIRRELPLNQAVEIAFTPQKAGEIEFVCGMNMLRGTLVVE